jgi:putative transferase (TIGR04331 family)
MFLALTSLEEFWDANDFNVFLGVWCKKYERKEFLKSIKYKVMDSPLMREGVAVVPYEYIMGIYEALLEELSERLNSLHGTDYSARYWRILLGPWLIHYLFISYDRYIHVSTALEKYPGIQTVLLAQDDYRTCMDTRDFWCSVDEDAYNLQLYSQVIKFLGYKFQSKKKKNEKNFMYDLLGARKGSWKGRLVAKLRLFLKTIIATHLFKGIIVFQNSYFPYRSERRLILKMLGRLLTVNEQKFSLEKYKFNVEKRSILEDVTSKGDDFCCYISKMLKNDIPHCFVEAYKDITAEGIKAYPENTKVFFSANSWGTAEIFKNRAASLAERGAKLIGTQHGGLYEARLNFPEFEHNVSILDVYYTWGWERENTKAKIVPMFANKLIQHETIGADNQRCGVLWATSIATRYLYRFPEPPELFREYLRWHKRFAKELSGEVKAQLVVRPHGEEKGWGIVARLKNEISNLTIETQEVDFLESLKRYRLYVCDHLGTTYLEALASNMPTILFWSPTAKKIRLDVKPDYDMLRRQNILFDTPEGAAEMVNKIYNDVEKWWNDPERQEVITTFCSKMVRTSENALNDWKTELEKYL